MADKHESLLKRWDITEDELTEVVDQNPSLRGMLFGYTAEIKLRQYIVRNDSVTGIAKDDDHDRRKKGDLRGETSPRNASRIAGITQAENLDGRVARWPPCT